VRIDCAHVCRTRSARASASLEPSLAYSPLRYQEFSVSLRCRFPMATLLNLDAIESIAAVMRESYLSHVFIFVLLAFLLKYVVASWR
jgi:hypothetical protein